MRRRNASLLVLSLMLGSTGAFASGRVLDGGPIALERAKTWCVAPSGPLPNWSVPAHPECEMVWRVLAEKDGRILYSARYAWPSSRAGLRVLTEVLFEGIPGSRVVHRLYAVQDDEAHVRLAPLRLVSVGGTSVIESAVCMNETRECGRELALWRPGHIEAVKDLTVPELRSKLPRSYDLRMNPDVDVASLLGKGKAWAERDADCCPSATFEFTLRLDAGELHVDTITFQKPRI